MIHRCTHLGELEQDIMNIIWRRKTVSVRDVLAILSPKRSLAYTTVMTVMNRLVEKGLLRRRVEGACYCYAATSHREDFMASASRQVIDELLRSYGSIAVAEFLHKLDIADPALLRRLRQRFPPMS